MQSNNIKFTFIALNLFILIFFILLTSKAALNSEIHPIQDIFRSFRGESLTENRLIVLSAEEQRFIKAKEFFQEKLNSILVPSLNIAKSSRDNNLYIIKFSIKELYHKDASTSEDSIKWLLKSLLKIDDKAYGYELAVSITFNEGNIENGLELDKLYKIIADSMIKETTKAIEVKFEKDIDREYGEIAIGLVKEESI